MTSFIKAAREKVLTESSARAFRSPEEKLEKLSRRRLRFMVKKTENKNVEKQNIYFNGV